MRITCARAHYVDAQIWSFVAGRLYDNTSLHRSAIRADAARAWRLFRSPSRERQGYEPRGAAAAWAANEYRLGHRARTLRTLRRLARRGGLPGFPPRRQLRFVRELDGFLLRLDYTE